MVCLIWADAVRILGKSARSDGSPPAAAQQPPEASVDEPNRQCVSGDDASSALQNHREPVPCRIDGPLALYLA